MFLRVRGGCEQSGISHCWGEVAKMLLLGKEELQLPDLKFKRDDQPDRAVILGEPVWSSQEGGWSLLDLRGLHWYSAHSFPTVRAPVVKAFHTTKKIKYAKYNKGT